MKTTKSPWYLAVLAALAPVGCDGGATNAGSGPTNQAADTIASSDDPDKLAGLPWEVASTFSFKLADNIASTDVGNTFGTDDAHTPYPDTYWPMVNGGIDAQWNNGDTSPLEKYLNVTAPANVAAGKAWEQSNHGPMTANVASWWGHCPGWTGSALSNAPLSHAVSVTSDGQMSSCNAGDPGCVTFQIGDINALEAEVYVDADTRFIGNRCDTAASSIQRDANGRILRTGGGCQGLNAGSLVVLMGNIMKAQHHGFAIDAQSDFNTDQIWNQPAYSYTVNQFSPLTEAQAANYVVSGAPTGNETTYSWNTAAKGWVFIDVTLNWVSEHGPNLAPFPGSQSTNTTHMTAVIELDSDPTGASASIIGGEYVQDPSANTDRLTVPPFAWLPAGPGAEDEDPTVGTNNHNPYVKPSLVAQLVALAQQ